MITDKFLLYAAVICLIVTVAGRIFESGGVL